MKTINVLKWLPICTFMLITPCGSNTFCIPMLITLPVGLLAGDLNGVLPLVGIISIIYCNILGITKNKILFTVGVLLLLISIFKNIYNTLLDRSYAYIWDSSVTYLSLGLFAICSFVSIYSVFNLKTQQLKV